MEQELKVKKRKRQGEEGGDAAGFGANGDIEAGRAKRDKIMRALLGKW